MSQDTAMLNEIKEQLDSLVKLHAISHETHAEHHDFIAVLIKERQAKTEFYEEMLSKLLVAGAWGTVVVIGTLLWMGFKEWLHIHG